MKLITLVENTPGRWGCVSEHGLSIYIETGKHKILLDTGATDAFAKNAEVLGIDLGLVDMVVLSHGHYDHAGGILEFVQRNPKAPIYMRPEATNGYYNEKADGPQYIGIDERIRQLPQIIFTKDHEVLDASISLFSGVKGRRLWPTGNKSLKMLVNGEYLQDAFVHEQSLVIREEGCSVLLSGCAHNGILNILDRYRQLYGGLPDKVITGFHMKKNVPLNRGEIALVQETAEELKKMKNTSFYSGHCTGEEAFGIMKEILGEQLTALHSGYCLEE